jgi:hypothetical protein
MRLARGDLGIVELVKRAVVSLAIFAAATGA